MTQSFDDSNDNGTPAPTTVIDPTVAAPQPAVVPDEIRKLQKRLDDKDAFIETLKGERQQDRQLLDSVTQKLELLLRAQEMNDDGAPRPTAQPTPAISPEELRKQGFVTREDLEAEQRALVAKSNLQSVLEIGRKQYGERLNEHVAKRCQEIGVSVEWAKSQAASNPNVFIELFGLNKQGKTPVQPTDSAISTASYREPAPAAPKSVMLGASTRDVVDAWKRTADSE